MDPQAPDVRAQFVPIALVTTSGACHKHERQGYGSREDDKRVLLPIVTQPRVSQTGARMKSVTQSTMRSIEKQFPRAQH
jgi:hypothetical protein